MSRALPIHLSAGVLLAPLGFAQTLSDVRDDVRESLRQAKFAGGLAGLVLLGEELELSGASYVIDSTNDTEISSLVLPFSRVLEPFERDGLDLYTEGVVGFTRATGSAADFYAGALPGFETSVDSEWTSYTAFAGAGPRFELAESLTVATILSVGVSRLENDTSYGGPGAAPTAALLDGLAFNWGAWAMNYGAAARFDWEHTLGERRSLAVVGRYDFRWTSTFEADDPAQEFTTRLQLATVRAEYAAPTGWSAGKYPLDFTTHVGLRRLTEGDVFGVQEIAEVGGSLEFLTGDDLPLASGVYFGGALFFGDRLEGWTLGLGLSF